MVLTDVEQIAAAKRPSTAAVTSADVTNPTSIDNEAIRTGITRKVRRVTFVNLDNNVVRFRFARWTTGAGTGVALNKSQVLTPFGNAVMEPDETEEWVISQLGPAAGTTRLAGFLTLISGAAIANGVDVNPEYYDDLN